MLRRLITRLAVAFPPKFISDRLLPWATLLLATVGGVWAIHEYRNDLSISRVTTIIDLHERYTEKLFLAKREFALAISPTLLRARCEFIRNALEDGKLTPESNMPLDCEDIDDGTLEVLKMYNLEGMLRAEQREYIFAEIGQTKLSGKQSNSLVQLSILFNSVIVCVDHGNCDPGTTVALFAREMVEFVNMACAFDAQASRGSKTETEKIARFLVDRDVHKNIYWSLDANREKLFACDHLRALED